MLSALQRRGLRTGVEFVGNDARRFWRYKILPPARFCRRRLLMLVIARNRKEAAGLNRQSTISLKNEFMCSVTESKGGWFWGLRMHAWAIILAAPRGFTIWWLLLSDRRTYLPLRQIDAG